VLSVYEGYDYLYLRPPRRSAAGRGGHGVLGEGGLRGDCLPEASPMSAMAGLTCRAYRRIGALAWSGREGETCFKAYAFSEAKKVSGDFQSQETIITGGFGWGEGP